MDMRIIYTSAVRPSQAPPARSARTARRKCGRGGVGGRKRHPATMLQNSCVAGGHLDATPRRAAQAAQYARRRLELARGEGVAHA